MTARLRLYTLHTAYRHNATQSIPCCRLFHVSTRQLTQANVNNDVRMNAAKVQLLSPKLHEQIFGAPPRRKQVRDAKERQKLAQEHLERQGVWGKDTEIQAPVNVTVPKLYGKDIEEHFMRLGFEQAEPYITKSEAFAKADLPERPSQWIQQSGWTRYDKDGNRTSVPAPLEDELVFDVEVLVQDSKFPVIAVAASTEAWYSWTSPYVTGESNSPIHLIPMLSDKNPSTSRMVVGHNVGYDRARIAEEYSRVSSGIRYLDTMSLHIAVSGLCSQQRPAWIKRSNEEKQRLEGSTATGPDALDTVHGGPNFFDVSSLNSLKDVAKFHCKIDMDKTQRSYFETGTLQDVRDNFNECMTYCAQDVQVTHAIYKNVLPRFRSNCPHPVSFAGMLHMGNSFLTVNENWERYLANSTRKHEELATLVDIKLCDLADKARELVDQPEIWQKDPWLSQLDWYVNPRQRKLKGAPKWFKDAYDTKADRFKVSIRSRIAPLLLRLKWQGHPLHHLPKHGWCFKVAHEQLDQENLNGSQQVMRDEQYAYYKVPHKDGPEANCGNPLAKNYIGAFENNVLTSEYDAAKQALELNAKSAYWISSRERILGQFVVWDDQVNHDMCMPFKQPGQRHGMILPQMLTMGTITRRAVERTWLTASNAKANRIGSELKSMVQAPEGYKIIGADVDSEELWISSIIGDAQFGFHGASALGWMTLQGSKADGTDLHSKTANILGISRDKAKIFNYARIYGAGVKYATSLLLQYAQGMNADTAKSRALDLYANTKGEKEHSSKNHFQRTFWHGGSESYMFNALEEIALSNEPRTPVLGCGITDALKPKYTGSQFLTSRVNWVVQSSGVDYLHLLIVSMAHLIERYKIDARFMLSVHDEVRYLSSEKDQHRTALALQVANLWTRALFSWKLGLASLPQSVAFFSAVDVDHVLRKEPSMTCTTPSNEIKIEEGVSCTIQDTLSQLEQDTHSSINCLLGEEHPTPGATIDNKLIKQTKQMLPEPQKKCTLDFLKAQMCMDLEEIWSAPEMNGGVETEDIATATPPARPSSPVQPLLSQQQAYTTTTTPMSQRVGRSSSSIVILKRSNRTRKPLHLKQPMH